MKINDQVLIVKLFLKKPKILRQLVFTKVVHQLVLHQRQWQSGPSFIVKNQLEVLLAYYFGHEKIHKTNIITNVIEKKT